MKSWKTFSTGAASVAGGVAGLYFGYKHNSLDAVTVPAFLTTILTGIGLMFARDNNVSSVDVGIQGVDVNHQGQTVVTPVGPKASDELKEKMPCLIQETREGKANGTIPPP